MNKFLKFFESALFPKNIKCVICGDDLDRDKKYNICDRCLKDLPYITGKTCAKCGAPIRDMGKVCINCKNVNHVFQSSMSVFMYDTPIRELVVNLKFNNRKYLSETLANFIATKVVESGKKYDLVVPVPMSEKALQTRGYNQSWLLCDTLGKLGYDVRDNVLIKTKDTHTQVGLEKDERISNLKGVFKVKDRKAVKGKVVLLVDDVITTGTTLDECATTLIHAGASKVYCVTLCHA